MRPLAIARSLAAGSTLVALLAALGAPALAIPRPGEPAPPFSLATTDGKMLSPAALKGKPAYLNFFATWCGPCRVETPSIVGLSKKYGARLRVVGIDVGENAGRANGFRTDFKIPYELAIDPDTTMRASYGAGLFFPIHVFIDAKGIVRAFHPGEMSAAEIEAAIKMVVKN